MPTTTNRCQQAVGGELLAHLRADELNALQLGVGVHCVQGCHHLLALHGRGDGLAVRAGLERQTDHHVARGAEVLHLRIGVAELLNVAADLRQIGGLGVSDFHHRTAGELHRQVQPLVEQEEDSGDKRQERQRVEDQRVLHERNVAADAEKLHGLPFVATAPSCWGRCRFYARFVVGGVITWRAIPRSYCPASTPARWRRSGASSCGRTRGSRDRG